MKLVEIKDVRVGQVWKADKDVLYIVSDYNKPFVPSSISIESFESAGLQNRYTIIGKLGITHRIENGKLTEIPRTSDYQIDDIIKVDWKDKADTELDVVRAVFTNGVVAYFNLDFLYKEQIKKVGILGVTHELVNDRGLE